HGAAGVVDGGLPLLRRPGGSAGSEEPGTGHRVQAGGPRRPAAGPREPHLEGDARSRATTRHPNGGRWRLVRREGSRWRRRQGRNGHLQPRRLRVCAVLTIPVDALIGKLAKALDADADELLFLAQRIPDRMKRRILERPDAFRKLAELDDEGLE